MPPRRSATLAWWLSFFAIVVVVVAFAGSQSLLVVAWSVALIAWQLGFALRRGVVARARSRAHLAAEDASTQVDLREGPCVVEGSVAYAPNASEAMRMEFTQLGAETESSGSWSHSWTEISRKLTVHPFYLVRGDGKRIRVEPTRDESRLFDELESKILVTDVSDAAPKRLRFATLMPEERIWVTGRLERTHDPEQSGAAASSGYRESAAPEAWVLRGAPTLLVSSVSLASHFRQRAQRHLRHAIVYVLCLLAPGLVLARYVDRAEGRTIHTLSDELVRKETNDDGEIVGYVARGVENGITYETESLDVAPAAGTPLSFRAGNHSYNSGDSVRLTAKELLLTVAFGASMLLLRCLLTAWAVSSLPWYRSPKISVNDSGSGRLPGRG